MRLADIPGARGFVYPCDRVAEMALDEADQVQYQAAALPTDSVMMGRPRQFE